MNKVLLLLNTTFFKSFETNEIMSQEQPTVQKNTTATLNRTFTHTF